MRTYLDLIDRLRAYVGNDDSDQKSTAVIRAAAEAVQAISQKHDWMYFQTSGRFVTSVPYETGTVEFDLTGGANERQMTLTSGTWPTWAADGTIFISGIPYDVDRRISGTVVTIRTNTLPSGDIASGTQYVIRRSRYDLPTDFLSIRHPMIVGQTTRIVHVTYTQFLRRRSLNDGVGTPTMFTIEDNGYGRKQAFLWNPPDAEYPIEFEYKRQLAMPVVVEEISGRVSLTAASTVLTGTSTAFKASMAGAVLRVSYDQNRPTAFDGVDPPEYEYLIDTFTSSTVMALREAASASVSNRAFVISSRLDVADGPMFNYLVQMGYKRMRVSQRIPLIPEELRDYERAEQEARGYDGQTYGGTDQAMVEIANVGMYPYSYCRTIPGNG